MNDTEKRGKVLFVDDERKILKALYRACFQAEFDVFTASGGQEALEILEKENIDIIITDYKMPEMNGLQLLRTVNERYPMVYRAILSGFIEESEVYRSMTSGLTLTYFLKPWDDEMLNKRIVHILKVRSHLKNPELISKINSIKNLPVLPDIFINLVNAIADDRPAKDLYKIVEKDISISTKVLQIANSAFYSTNRHISLERVVIYLGINTIKNIVFTLSLYSQMKWNDYQTKQLEQISAHSTLVNRYMLKFHEILLESKIDDRYACVGLTHDIGKIILLQYFPDRYDEIQKKKEEGPDYDFYQSECTLGYGDYTHCEIGGYFLDSWNFAEPAVDAALFHHIPEKTASYFSDILKILYLTDQLVNQISHGKTREALQLPQLDITGSVDLEPIITEMYGDMQRDSEVIKVTE